MKIRLSDRPAVILEGGPEEILHQMHGTAMIKETDDTTYMRQVARCARIQTGRRVNGRNPAKCVKDLIRAGLLIEVEP